MAKPTFDINDLVTQMGRKPAYPFGLPGTKSDQSDINEMLGQQPETQFLQPGPSPTPTPTPAPKKKSYAT